MNLDHVASYLAVLDTGSFHTAARQRGLSQASISLHVRALEEQQRNPLVVRDRAGCRPVPGTEEFTRLARQLADLAARAAAALTHTSLVIGASSNIGTYLIQPAFAQFRAAHAADMDTRLVLGTNAAIADQLTSGALDLAVMEWWDNRPGFEALHWRDEEVVVIVGPDHPWRTRRTIAPASLAGQPILGGEPQTGTGTLLRDRLGPAAGDLTITMNLGNTEAVKRAVRHGLGISLVLAGTVQDELASNHLHTLRVKGPPLRKTLWCILRRTDPATSPARQFATHLQRTA
jgi:DNA-binding transcriptional LysR family regulator